MGTIIYILGVVLAVITVLDILKKNISLPWKLIWSILVLATSWVGLALYYLAIQKNIENWSK